MFLHIINYTVRGMIILLGVLLLSGIINVGTADSTFIKVMGVVFILFGIYRISIYRMQSKKYNFSINEEENDENEK